MKCRPQGHQARLLPHTVSVRHTRRRDTEPHVQSFLCRRPKQHDTTSGEETSTSTGLSLVRVLDMLNWKVLQA